MKDPVRGQGRQSSVHSLGEYGAIVILFGLLIALGGREIKFPCVRADHSVSGSSAYFVAVDRNRVGYYPAPHSKTMWVPKYFHVLEYRVWLSPMSGAEPENGGRPYYAAFAQYEKARDFSELTRGASEPVALIDASPAATEVPIATLPRESTMQRSLASSSPPRPSFR
jgi:hypothetical protein